MLKKFVHLRGWLFLFVLLGAAAWAQTEIMPDHYPDEAAPASAALGSEQQSRIQVLQSRIARCEQQLRAKFEMVENARQEAISAGIQGDGAGSSIDEFRRQQHELDLLAMSLEPQITQVKNAIRDLQNQRTVVASAKVPARNFRPAVKPAASPVLLSSRRIAR